MNKQHANSHITKKAAPFSAAFFISINVMLILDKDEVSRRHITRMQAEQSDIT
jgi:hypothetical protein